MKKGTVWSWRNSESSENASGAAIKRTSMVYQGWGKITLPAVSKQCQLYSQILPEQKVKAMGWQKKKKRTLESYTIDRAERVWDFYYDAKCFCCSCQGIRIFLQYSFYWNNLGVHKHTYFKIKVWMYHVLSRFSRVQLFATLWRPPGSSVHEILQARILEWVTISHSRGSSGPRDWTRVSYDSCTTVDCNSIWISKIWQERKFHSWAGRWLWP